MPPAVTLQDLSKPSGSAAPHAEGTKAQSIDDAPGTPRQPRVFAQRLVRLPTQVAFDAQRAAQQPDRHQSARGHMARRGRAHAKVAQAIGRVCVVGVQFSDEPPGSAARVEPLDHRMRIEARVAARCLAVGEQ